MKYKKILIAILISIAIIITGNYKVEAAGVEISASKYTVEVGESVVITVKFTAAAWNINVSGTGITGASYASQTSDLSEIETVKTFNLDTSKAGTYTITVKGDITDKDGNTQEITGKTCTVTIKEKPVTPEPEPEPTPDPEPEPEPETPVEQTPNFTNTNKTMYASKDNMNLRASWSTSSEATTVNKGTELTVTGTSTNKVNGYVWYRVSYNGKTLYVANYLLTDTKPAEDEPQEEPTDEPEPEKPTVTTEEPENDNTAAEAKEGLKSLEIAGLTLSPAFSSNVYEYRVIVKEDISELTINAVPAVEGASITIAGNKNLQEGENLITLMVYNEANAVEATYQITVNKNTVDLSITNKILQAGNNAATRNLIIFFVLLIIAIIGLIVVIVLKRRNQEYDEDYEENYENYGENYEEQSTENEQTVENASEEVEPEEIKNEISQEEQFKPRQEKRKGKHF